MKIAIISDSHDNIPNLEQALKFINEQNIKLIIHCGDLAAPSMLSRVMAPNFQGEIHLVHGNVGDPELLKGLAKKYKNVQVHGTTGQLDIDGKKIAFTHFPDVAKKLAKTGKYDYVFYGHTHRPWIETQINADVTRTHADKNISVNQRGIRQRKSALLVNPGTLAGMFYKATFAILNTANNKLELKILEKLS